MTVLVEAIILVDLVWCEKDYDINFRIFCWYHKKSAVSWVDYSRSCLGLCDLRLYTNGRSYFYWLNMTTVGMKKTAATHLRNFSSSFDLGRDRYGEKGRQFFSSVSDRWLYLEVREKKLALHAQFSFSPNCPQQHQFIAFGAVMVGSVFSKVLVRFCERRIFQK